MRSIQHFVDAKVQLYVLEHIAGQFQIGNKRAMYIVALSPFGEAVPCNAAVSQNSNDGPTHVRGDVSSYQPVK